MAQWTDLVDARFVAVMESARGSTGLGADALARCLPSGRYRRSTYAAPMTDLAFPAGDFDRNYEPIFGGIGQDPDPQNPLDGTELVACPVDLTIGFAFGKEIPQFISTTGTEVAVTAATYYSRRVTNEIHRILRAVTFPAITCGDLGSSVSLIECVRRPGTVSGYVPAGPGRVIATIMLDLLVEIPTGTSFDP